MKKTFLVFLLLSAFICSSAQTKKTESRKFLDRYTALIKRMDVKYSENVDSLYAWKVERSKIRTLYKEKYRFVFSDDEIEEYSSLNAQYTSRSAEFKLDKLGEKVDTIGQKVSRTIKKTGKKLSGVLKGLKQQSDANRKN